MMQSVLLGVSGASGSLYAKHFIESAAAIEGLELNIIFTKTAEQVWLHEIGVPYKDFIASLANSPACKASAVNLIENDNFHHKYASGSNKLDAMVVLPCSMGSLARIATGITADLIGRIADVQLKERRKLILVPRETPYNLIHLNNMTTLTQAGAIICPASPSFYTKPATLHDLCRSLAERVMNIAGIKDLSGEFKW